MNKYIKALGLILCTLVCSSTMVATAAAPTPRKQTRMEEFCAGTQQFTAGFAAFVLVLGGVAYTMQTLESAPLFVNDAVSLCVNAGQGNTSQIAKSLFKNGTATFARAVATVGLFKTAQYLARHTAQNDTPDQG